MPPSIAFKNVTSRSFTVYVTGLDSTYQFGDRYVMWNFYGYVYQSIYIPAYATQGGDSNWDIPAAGTYTMSGVVYFNTGSVDLGSASVTLTDGGGSRPALFYWSTYGNAPPDDGQRVFIPNATQWNKLVDNITAVGIYKNRPYSNISQVYYGQALNASNYIEVAKAINHITNNSLAVSEPPTGKILLRCSWFYNVERILNEIS